MVEENKNPANGTHPARSDEAQAEEAEISTRPQWREVLRQAFDKARREQQPASRRELGRDRSRSLFLLAGAAIAVLLLFLGVFSSSNTKKTTGARPIGTPALGRRETPGQQRSGQPGSVTPLLNAQTSQTDVAPEQDVTPEEIGRTARSTQFLPPSTPTPVTNPRTVGRYAIGRIHFSDTPQREGPGPSKPAQEPTSDDLPKSSLVFVRSAQNDTANASPGLKRVAIEQNPMTLELPTGTRLMARLEAVVSSAVKNPVVAAIEYNYERDGKIVVPAGAQVIGNLQQADRFGYVGIRFDTIQMPDGSAEKVDATAMSLSFGPLKGVVSGKRTGTNFLLRAVRGIGQAAAYLVGSNGIDAPLSEGTLLRDQIATNVGIAGDQQLNSLAFNQNIVVSIPGNTRFYVVIEKGTRSLENQGRHAGPQMAGEEFPPTAQELRELLQLQRELHALYQQPSLRETAKQAPY